MGLSTADSVYHLVESAKERKKASKCPVGVFCDFSRAFDRVNLNVFTTTLYVYDVKGIPLP